MEPFFIGEVSMFAGNFAPRGWAFCEGQLLSIAQYTALFSILGTTYGGDGRTTFALPDLRGRIPVGTGTGAGLSTWTLGEKGGAEETTLSLMQMPYHNHIAQISTMPEATMEVSADLATEATPAPMNEVGAPQTTDGNPINGYVSGAPDVTMSVNSFQGVSGTVTLSNTGDNQPYNNMMPSAVINFIIALQGMYPSRS